VGTALKSYSLVFIYTLFVFVSIPYARVVRDFIADNFSRNFFGYFVFAVIAAGFLSAVFFITTGSITKNKKKYLWLGCVTAAYCYGTLKLWKCPEDAIHFITYGVLSCLLFRALSFHIQDISIYFTASLIVLFIGTVDEVIQWFIPDRVWNYKDVGVNCLSGFLIQIGIWQGIQPSRIKKAISFDSIKIFFKVLTACIVLLGLCALNTPSRIAYYTEKIPQLSFLRQNHNIMSEYGYKHKDVEIGVFYSRLTKEALKDIDSREYKTYALILNEQPDADYAYKKFLKKYTPFNYPFLYEMRIHLYRRDVYLSLAKDPNNTPSKIKNALAVAYKENLILEKYFNQTLQHSIFYWSRQEVNEIKKNIDTTSYYESPVSRDLFTSFNELHVWFAVITVFSCLFIIPNILKRYFRSKAFHAKSSLG